MKWLLPDPNEPLRNAPRLTPVVIASATSPSASSNASHKRRRDHVLVDRSRNPRLLDTIRQPQHIVLSPCGLGDVKDIAQQLTHRHTTPAPTSAFRSFLPTTHRCFGAPGRKLLQGFPDLRSSLFKLLPADLGIARSVVLDDLGVPQLYPRLQLG